MSETGSDDDDGDAPLDDDDSFLRDVAGMQAAPPPLEPIPGEVIDQTYQVVRELGAGGMGVVYLARDLRLQRDVALKVHGADGASATRLRREATAIAQLTHPHVITVYEIGLWKSHPFVAMEYLDGGTARTWLASGTRSWRDIVGFYVAAGRGLAAAHAAGMVHRDFKPDNVLVGKDGRIRVADFGLARPHSQPSEAGDEDLVSRSGVALPQITGLGGVVGTPAYMAPEQYRGDEVGPAADQYAFCVALWEALSGERPVSANATTAVGEAARPRPHTTTAAGRRLPRRLRAILARGLAEEPAARFPSMDALVEALARTPGMLRRRALAAGAAIAVVGVAAYLLLGRDAAVEPCAHAGDRIAGAWDPARREAMRTRFALTGAPDALALFDRVAERLDDYAGRWSGQRVEACRAARVDHDQTADLYALRDHCLDRRRLELSATVDVLTRRLDVATVATALDAVHALGDLDDCADVATLSGQIAPPADPANRAAALTIDATLAQVGALETAGKFDQALAIARDAVARAQALDYPPLLANAQLWLGTLQNDVGDPTAAKATIEAAAHAAADARDDHTAASAWLLLFEITGQKLDKIDEAEALRPVAEAAVSRAGNRADQRAALTSAIAMQRDKQGKHDEAHRLLEDAIATLEKQLGPDSVELAQHLNRLGMVEKAQGDYDGARASLERALGLLENAYGPDHPHVAATLNNLGTVELESGKRDDALASFQRALAIKQATLGKDHPDLANTMSNIGVVLRGLGRREEARSYLERALAMFENKGSPTSIARAEVNLAGLLHELGDHDKGRAMYQEALAIEEKVYGPDHPEVAHTLSELGNLELSVDHIADADADLTRAHHIADQALGPANPVSASISGSLATVYAAEGKPDDAIALVRATLVTYEAKNGAATVDGARGHAQLGMLLIEHGDRTEARKELERARTALATALGESSLDVAQVDVSIADLDLDAGHAADAAKRYQGALDAQAATLGPDASDLAAAEVGLSHALLAQGDIAGATAAAKRGVAQSTEEPSHHGDALFALAQAVAAGGDRARGEQLAHQAEEAYPPEALDKHAAVAAWLHARR